MRILYSVAAFLALSCGGASAQEAGQVSDTTIQHLQALERAKLQRTPAEKKMSSNLLNAVRASAGKPSAAGAPVQHSTTEAVGDDNVMLTLKGEVTPELQQFIAAQGATRIQPRRNILSFELPLSRVETVTERPEVKSIDLSAKSQTNQAAALQTLQNPEGDLAHAAAAARMQYNTTGDGVKVCVISDSVRYLQQAQASGALGPVHVIDGQSGTDIPGYPNTGEGTAMLEIVHRIAPGAVLEFATANPTDVTMANNIDAFREGGCNIIVDDITYLNESPFQDGVIADSVAAAVKAEILYFSSAANSGSQAHGTSGTWEGDFRPSTQTFTVASKTYTFHEFAPGVVFNRVTDTSGVEGRPLATLFWNDPLGAATNEYQLALVDANNRVIAHSNTDIDGNADPYQYLNYRVGDRIAILRAPGAQPRFLHLATNRGRLSISTTGATQGHNASSHALTVASISARGRQDAFIGGTDVSADIWSSDGPRRVFYDSEGHPVTPGNLTGAGGMLLQKPDFTAADCVTTDNPQAGLSLFCGTSAAAPHAAAIAALLMAARPTLTLAQIRAALTTTSLDIETPGWDAVSGMGIVMPGPALQAAAAMQPLIGSGLK
jgi:subtilisin family serine protease